MQQQIADWLEKLGMSEYTQCFAENRIDFSVLPDLTAGPTLNRATPGAARLMVAIWSR